MLGPDGRITKADFIRYVLAMVECSPTGAFADPEQEQKLLGAVRMTGPAARLAVSFWFDSDDARARVPCPRRPSRCTLHIECRFLDERRTGESARRAGLDA